MIVGLGIFSLLPNFCVIRAIILSMCKTSYYFLLLEYHLCNLAFMLSNLKGIFFCLNIIYATWPLIFILASEHISQDSMIGSFGITIKTAFFNYISCELLLQKNFKWTSPPNAISLLENSSEGISVLYCDSWYFWYLLYGLLFPCQTQ